MTVLDERRNDLRVVRDALATHLAGSTVTSESIARELAAAQIPGQRFGPLMGAACRRGWIRPTGRVIPASHPAAHGRLIRTYLVTGLAEHEEQKEAA